MKIDETVFFIFPKEILTIFFSEVCLTRQKSGGGYGHHAEEHRYETRLSLLLILEFLGLHPTWPPTCFVSLHTIPGGYIWAHVVFCK